jgi:hypothetical protein
MQDWFVITDVSGSERYINLGQARYVITDSADECKIGFDENHEIVIHGDGALQIIQAIRKNLIHA